MSVNTKVNGNLVKSAGLYKVSTPIGIADIYSFEEREVGVWTDGKPLYQKTIYVASGSLSSGYYAVPNGLSGISDLVDYECLLKIDATSQKIVLPRVRTTLNECLSMECRVNSDNTVVTQLVVFNGSTQYYGAISDIEITIKYTKTTDVAGSGIYVPSGDKAVHYSTDEQVIGTWIDGSTLYRKTINFGALPNAADKSIAHGINNLGYVCKADAVGYNTTSGLRIPFPMTNSSYLNQQVSWWINDTSVVFRTAVDYTSSNVCYVILEYTKTS